MSDEELTPEQQRIRDEARRFLDERGITQHAVDSAVAGGTSPTEPIIPPSTEEEAQRAALDSIATSHSADGPWSDAVGEAQLEGLMSAPRARPSDAEMTQAMAPVARGLGEDTAADGSVSRARALGSPRRPTTGIRTPEEQAAVTARDTQTLDSAVDDSGSSQASDAPSYDMSDEDRAIRDSALAQIAEIPTPEVVTDPDSPPVPTMTFSPEDPGEEFGFGEQPPPIRHLTLGEEGPPIRSVTLEEGRIPRMTEEEYQASLAEEAATEDLGEPPPIRHLTLGEEGPPTSPEEAALTEMASGASTPQVAQAEIQPLANPQGMTEPGPTSPEAEIAPGEDALIQEALASFEEDQRRRRLSPSDLEAKAAEETAAVAALTPEQRLDYGLPTEAEIERSRRTETGRDFEHRLANAFRAAAGRPRVAYENQYQTQRDARAAGLRQRMGEKGEMRAQDEQQAAEAEARAENARLARERMTEVGRHNLAMEEARQAAGSRGRTRSEEPETLIADISQLSPSRRTRLLEGLQLTEDGYRESIRGMSPAARAGVHESLLRILGQRETARATGTGTGHFGGARDQATVSELRRLFPEQYPTDDAAHRHIDAVGLATARAEVSTASRRAPIRPPAPVPPTHEQSAAAAAATSLATIERTLQGYQEGDDLPGIGPIDSQVSTRLLGQEGRTLRRQTANLVDTYLRLTSGAAVPTSEIINVETNRLIGYDEEQFRAAIADMRREIEARRTGSEQSPTSSPHSTAEDVTETQRVSGPDGRIYNIPAERWNTMTAEQRERFSQVED